MTVHWTGEHHIAKRKIRWGCLFAFIIYFLTIGYVAWLGLMILIKWNWPAYQ